ncbi:MAG: hypothetical protein NTZ59_04030 [Bacteroidetes bacterium]|nr:hypothetical protein [Bacteroidota bacterium]
MKYIFFFLLITSIACSTSKQLNNKWIGRSDYEVVNEFGLPDSVYTIEVNQKIYLYKYKFKTKDEEADLAKSSTTIVKKVYNNDGRMIFTAEKKYFLFDSLNKVIKVEYFDTSYLSKGNIYHKVH